MGAARRRGTFEERRALAGAAGRAMAEARRATEEVGRARRQSTPAPTECAPGRAYPLATAASAPSGATDFPGEKRMEPNRQGPRKKGREVRASHASVFKAAWGGAACGMNA